jgi:hypothetical protein
LLWTISIRLQDGFSTLSSRMRSYKGDEGGYKLTPKIT